MDEKKIKIRQFKKKWNSIINIIKNLPDSELTDYLDTNDFENFIKAFFDASKIKEGEIIADFLLKNKNKSQAVALLHQIININCVLRNKKGILEGVVSPSCNQKDEDEVIFLESSNGKPFEGLIGSYNGEEAKYAVAGTDVKKGNDIDFGKLNFLSINEFKKIIKEQNLKKDLSDLENAKFELLGMLKDCIQDESRYQKFFIKNPWIFGLQYKQIDRHTQLDDKRIPDFTGVRVKDGHRDIFEIKQPFLKLFNQDSKFCSNFHDAIFQAEEYMRFSIYRSP